MLLYLLETKTINSHRKLTLRYYEGIWKISLLVDNKEEFKFNFTNEKDAKESLEYMYEYEKNLFKEGE